MTRISRQPADGPGSRMLRQWRGSALIVVAVGISMLIAACGTSQGRTGSAHPILRAGTSASAISRAVEPAFAATHRFDHAFLSTAPRSSCPAGELCPPPTPPTLQIAHTTLRVSSATTGILVSASVDLYLQAAGGTSPVDLLLRVDGRVVGQCDGFAAGGNGNAIACEGFVKNVGLGVHRIAMLATALGDRRVGVGPLSLTAVGGSGS